jgi:hypothetical protein
MNRLPSKMYGVPGYFGETEYIYNYISFSFNDMWVVAYIYLDFYHVNQAITNQTTRDLVL